MRSHQEILCRPEIGSALTFLSLVGGLSDEERDAIGVPFLLALVLFGAKYQLSFYFN